MDATKNYCLALTLIWMTFALIFIIYYKWQQLFLRLQLFTVKGEFPFNVRRCFETVSLIWPFVVDLLNDEKILKMYSLEHRKLILK